MGGTPARLIDAAGHEWPVTGYWCTVCGMPLHRTLRDAGAHPCCEVPAVGDPAVLTQPGHEEGTP